MKPTATYPVALLFLLLGAVLGSYLRYALTYGTAFPVPYTHVLHSHSHVLFFGWITIALGGLLRPDDRIFHKFLVPLCAAGTIGALITFWLFGYTGPAIGASAIFLVPWAYLAIRGLSEHQGFLSGGSASLLLAVGATLALPVAVANGGNVQLKSLFVAAFLHFLIDGWIFLSLMALLGGRPRERLPIVIYLVCIALAPLGETGSGHQALGSVGRGVAALLQLWWLVRERHNFSSPLLTVALTAGMAKALADITSALYVVPLSRELVIAHVHARTLAFASCGIVALLWHRLSRREGVVITLALGGGSILMPAALLYAGGAPLFFTPTISQIRIAHITAFYASLLATAGAAAVLIVALTQCLRSGDRCTE